MPFPSDNQVGNNSYIEFASVPAGGTVPVEYTVTVATAGSADETSLSVSADVEFRIRDGAILDFGGTQVEVAVPGGVGLQDSFLITTAPVNLPVKALTGTVAISSTATTYAYRLLLGTTDVSPSANIGSVDASDSLSGFGARTVVVSADRVVSVTGNRISNDRCFFEILDPYMNQDDSIQNLLYARAVLANGDTYEGPARLSTAGGANPNRNLRTYNMEVTFQGESGTVAGTYQFTPGDAAAFA